MGILEKGLHGHEFANMPLWAILAVILAVAIIGGFLLYRHTKRKGQTILVMALTIVTCTGMIGRAIYDKEKRLDPGQRPKTEDPYKQTATPYLVKNDTKDVYLVGMFGTDGEWYTESKYTTENQALERAKQLNKEITQ